MQAMDRLITEQWQDVYTLFSISRTVPFRLQNKGSDWITIQAVTTQPSPLSNEGVVLRTFDSLIITPDGGGCWVRVTNNTVVNAVITYHPLEGILFQDVPSGSQTQEGKEFSVSVDNIDTVATVQSYIMTISNGQLLNGSTSNVVLEPSTFCSDGVRSFKWNIYKNIQLTNAVFNNVDTHNSSVSYDTVATSFTPLQQNIVYTVITSKNQSVDISYLTRNITLYPNDTLTITVTSNGNGTVGCVIRWKEPT